MRHLGLLIALLCGILATPVRGGAPLRTAAEVTRIVQSPPSEWPAQYGRTFELVGTVLAGDSDVVLTDETDGVFVYGRNVTNRPTALLAGDIVRVSGVMQHQKSGRIIPDGREIKLLRHGLQLKPQNVTGKEFVQGSVDHKAVRLRGRVLDVITDEIDPIYTIVILDCDSERIPLSFSEMQDRRLIGRLVEAVGICVPAPCRSRQLIGRVLHAPQLRCLDESTKEPPDIPVLSGARYSQPKNLSSLGRCKLRGRVLAVWSRAVLIRTEDYLVARLDLTDGHQPVCDDIIEATGLPETDTYSLLLQHATWRKVGTATSAATEKPVDVPFASIFLDKDGHRRFDSMLHGRPIRTKATVRGIPSANGSIDYLLIGTDEWSLPVDISAALSRQQQLTVGCEVEVTGVYLLECQPWRPNAPIPPINGIKVIVRSEDDIRILSMPPWWTVGKLLVVIGFLILMLVFILIWNLTLRRLAENRGRKLSDERIARAEAEIKTMERTRLAVELHDTIAQNLTGVSIALDVARQFCQGTKPELRQQIDVADATLDSCQVELRNCLWDLRNQALEESDLNTAIRTVLQPHVADAALDIRFNVSRDRLTENTAHVILRIIRELVINAMRHGHATHIQIAGAIDPDALRFSVRDNGCGFDAERCPGIAQKHFGLQGIRERLSLLGGEMAVESTLDVGTRVVVTIPLPQCYDSD